MESFLLMPAKVTMGIVIATAVAECQRIVYRIVRGHELRPYGQVAEGSKRTRAAAAAGEIIIIIALFCNLYRVAIGLCCSFALRAINSNGRSNFLDGWWVV